MSFKFRNFNQKPVVAGPEALYTVLDPRSPTSEAYRSLRTNIQFSSLEQPLRTLLLTSPRPGQDKTIAAANLAVIFAQMGSRVILIDADLRRPALHRIFGLANDQGLTTALLSRAAAGLANGSPAVVQELAPAAPNIPNLRILTSGPLPPNPAEVLSSAVMRGLIESLKSEADYIIFDSPPVLAVTDAALLATGLDGVLLVLRAGATNRDDAREAKAHLEQVHANLLGIILTNARESRSRYEY